MKLKVFWKNDCPHCPDAKKLAQALEEMLEVQYLSVDSVDGLSEACMFNIMSTPSLVIVDKSDQEIESWRGVVPGFDEIKNKVLDSEEN